MLSFVPSLIVLGGAALAAAGLAERRPSPPDRVGERRAAAVALAVAVAIQGIHFTEEAVTGLHQRLGPLFGLPPMPFVPFLVFNLGWLVIWIIAVPQLRWGPTWAFFAAWFLAIAAILNGVAHPLLALAVAGYFPGLFSSPLIGVAGLVLWKRLRSATRRGEAIGLSIAS